MDVLAAIVDRFEGELVVLRLPDEQELALPSIMLPRSSNVGSTVNLSLGAAGSGSENSATSRQLLNELLQGSTGDTHGSV